MGEGSPISRVPPGAKVEANSETQESSSHHVNGLQPSPQSTPPVGTTETVPATLSPSSAADMAQGIDDNESSTPNTRRRLRARSEVPSLVESDLVAAVMEPLTDEERQSWPGWVELESDPVSPIREEFLPFNARLIRTL
jgi:hypothetical protein